jgi:hypothetical protein
MKALRKVRTAILRVEASQRRTDTRGQAMKRRERTRHLIELGGLVQKAGLIELTDDDRAVLLGAFCACETRMEEGRANSEGHSLWQLRARHLGRRTSHREGVSVGLRPADHRQ